MVTAQNSVDENELQEFIEDALVKYTAVWFEYIYIYNII